jgi:hypothetical protein
MFVFIQLLTFLKRAVPLNVLHFDFSDEDEQLPEESTSSVDVSAWKELFVPEPILNALRDLGFQEPTPIQRQTLPAAIKGRRDIVGAAETGSGALKSEGGGILTNFIKFRIQIVLIIFVIRNPLPK